MCRLAVYGSALSLGVIGFLLPFDLKKVKQNIFLYYSSGIQFVSLFLFELDGLLKFVGKDY